MHLEPDGSTYQAVREEFLSGAPLPLTDAVIHPGDGAMCFAIGGRRVQSGLYRVTYTGTESTALVAAKPTTSPARDIRHRLEALHGKADPQALAVAWPHLGHADRFIRWAARTAIEHVPSAQWADRALTEKNPSARMEALLGLARIGGISPPHRTRESPPVDTELGKKILGALVTADWQDLDGERRAMLVRTAEITLHRFDLLPGKDTAALLAKLDPLFPASTPELSWLLCETLVYLRSPTVAAKTMALIAAAPTQEEQIEYTRSLRMLATG